MIEIQNRANLMQVKLKKLKERDIFLWLRRKKLKINGFFLKFIANKTQVCREAKVFYIKPFLQNPYLLKSQVIFTRQSYCQILHIGKILKSVQDLQILAKSIHICKIHVLSSRIHVTIKKLNLPYLVYD